MLVGAACLVMASCSSLRSVSSTGIKHDIKTLGFSPTSDEMQQLVARELEEIGFARASGEQVASLLERLHLTECQALEPSNVSQLRNMGIDAFVSMKTENGHDGLPYLVCLTVTDTFNGRMVLAAIWKNDLGKDLHSSARDVAYQLRRLLADLQPRE
jgi:hypothetical protein